MSQFLYWELGFLSWGGILFGVGGERGGRRQNAFAPFPGGLNDPHLDLDLLVISHTEVFVEFDGIAVDSAMQ